MRDPLIEPVEGDIVQSRCYVLQDDGLQPGRRVVTHVGSVYIKYLASTGRSVVERRCMRGSWRRWCREHNAYVIQEK